jgi:NAD(P)-dependent dehydrogenase (short-subunit alcohol dehydrogenase family)
LGTIPKKHFDDQINVNVKGLLFTVQKVLLLLVNGASIILNVSGATIKANPGASVYSIIKVTVRSFART